MVLSVRSKVKETQEGIAIEGAAYNDMTDDGLILRRLTKTHHTLSHAECA